MVRYREQAGRQEPRAEQPDRQTKPQAPASQQQHPTPDVIESQPDQSEDDQVVISDFAPVFALLFAKFQKPEVRERNQNGKTYYYITARAVMNRLDEVLGPENWWDDYEVICEGRAVICRLSIRLAPQTETLPDLVVTKVDVGGMTKTNDASDTEKSGFSDAFKRAAVKFGVGRHLYGEGIPPSIRYTLAQITGAK